MQRLRKRIDSIDKELLKLLTQRVQVAQQIGEYKSRHGLPVFDQKREQKVLRKISLLAKHLNSPVEVIEIYKNIMTIAKRFQKPPIGKLTHSKKINIGVVGTGLIGGSVIKCLNVNGPHFKVFAYDIKRPANIGRYIDKWCKSFNDLNQCDIIVLCTPIDSILKLKKSDFAHTKDQCVVVDFASTKTKVSNHLRSLKLKNYVAGHPLAGKAKDGFEHSDANLFFGKPFLYSEFIKNSKSRKMFTTFVTTLGLSHQKINEVEHDRILAKTSHLPQLLSTALTLLLAKEKRLFFGPALIEMTRLADSSSEVWMPIFKTNEENIGRAIDEITVILKNLKRSLGGAKVAQYFDLAKKVRRRIA